MIVKILARRVLRNNGSQGTRQILVVLEDAPKRGLAHDRESGERVQVTSPGLFALGRIEEPWDAGDA